MRFPSILEFSLRHQSLLLALLINGISDLVGCFGFLAYDAHASRELKVRDLQSAAELIATNTTVARVR